MGQLHAQVANMTNAIYYHGFIPQVKLNIRVRPLWALEGSLSYFINYFEFGHKAWRMLRFFFIEIQSICRHLTVLFWCLLLIFRLPSTTPLLFE